MGRTCAIAAVLTLLTTVAAAQQDTAHDIPIALPSGLEARLQEVVWDRTGMGVAYRFRYVAPGFSDETANFEDLMRDLEFLCHEHALPRLADIGPKPAQLIVSLADKPSEFGVHDPDVAQVFEAYRIENGTCIWEAF